jgi:hemolysin III
VAVVPLWRALTPVGFGWLVAGGALYTLGIVFFVADKRVRHGHGIWHLFVLGGSACHFYTMLRFVA